MKYIEYISLFFIIYSSLIFSSCNVNNPKQGKLTITDDKGNRLSFDKTPERIISLAPSITETIYAIHADSLLVGVTKYCDYPADVKNKIIIGGMLDPNIEIITKLNFDLILLTSEGNSINTYKSLINASFKVFVSSPQNIDGIIKMINDYGVLTNRKQYSEKIAVDISKEKNYLDSINKQNKFFPDCLILVSVNPMITINKNVFINEVVELAGFNNIFKNELTDYPAINVESVIFKDPEYIFVFSDTSNANLCKEIRLELEKNIQFTKAVKYNKIYFLDENLSSRPGPRVMRLVNNLKKFRL